MSIIYLRTDEPAKSIDQVIEYVDEIIDVTRREASTIGYFAVLYRHVALSFKDAHAKGIFKRPDLIDGLDVAFLNRYLDALRLYQRGEKPSDPWHVAFEASLSPTPVVLQHLLLGMNAHINYDLGIAVAQNSRDAQQLALLRDDFETMNAVLGSLLVDVNEDLTRVWPMWGVIHRLVGRIEDKIVNFSMREARELAWKFAETLVALDPAEQEAHIAEMDRMVAALAHPIWKPPFPMNVLLFLARLGERGSVVQKIDDFYHRLRQRLQPTPLEPAKPQRGSLDPLPATGDPPAGISKKKVAILGGGVSSLITALELSDPDNPRRDEYDLTVYQLGWRLGGKGASGRNLEHQYRIEEHGLHIWFGCYDNAFQMIRKVYRELNRVPDAPLASWREAFEPHNEIVLKEHVAGDWRNWPGGLPPNDMEPGDGQALLPLWEYLIEALNWLRKRFGQSQHAGPSPTGVAEVHFSQGLMRWIDDLTSDVESEALNLGLTLLHAAYRLAHQIHHDPQAVKTLHQKHHPSLADWLEKETEHIKNRIESDLHGLTHDLLIQLLQAFLGWYWARVKGQIETHDDERRIWILANFMFANLRGGLEDDILGKGFDSINDHDYRDWMAQYAFDDDDLMLNSAWTLGTYDAMFAYVNGDNRISEGQAWPPNAKLEAGTVMRAGIRQFLTYKGASVWKMQAGMGDTVFGPIYEVLKRRGVKFEFFQCVREVTASEDGKTVDAIQVSRQVTIKPEQQAKGGYDPLIEVKGLACWPGTPRYEQLVEGEKLKASGANLEDYCADWQDAETYTLRRGENFDLVVLGISLGALPYLCQDLIAKSQKWARMIEHMRTIRTQSAQLWLKPTASQLGWSLMQRPIVTGYDIIEMDTWADMSHLIDREGWTVENYPLNISYFAGPMRDEQPLPPLDPRADCKDLDQAAADAKVRANALDLLNKHIAPFCMPDAIVPGAGGGESSFRWDLLVDPNPGAPPGEGRFDTQYWHANVQPSERYVLSVPGSTKHRLHPHDPQEFSNLFVTGDWIYNGFNLGCIEGATMAGRYTANALCDYPKREAIIGLDF